jgi:O-antigen/teichoic acid export membrane protein
MRYFKNTSWMFGEHVLRMAAGVLVGIWVARYLGPEQFGVFSYVMAFVAIFSSVAKLGLDSIVVRDLVNEPEKRDIYLGTAFWLKLMGALVMLAVIAFATIFTRNDHTTNLYIFIIASGIIFQSFEVIDFYLQSKVLSKFVSICKITQLLLSSLLKIYFVLTGADLFWFVMVSLVDQMTLAFSLYAAYKYQKLGSFYRCFDWDTAKKLLQDSWPLIFSGLAIVVYMRIDQVMIKEMLGAKEVGLFSAAVRLSEVWYFIPVIIATSLFPAIVNAKSIDTELYYSRLQKLYDLMLLVALGVALPMTFLSDWLVTFLYGDDYLQSGGVLAIHIWTGVFVFLGVVNAKFLLVEGLMRVMFYFTLACSVLNLFFNFFLIPKYGLYGAAIATLCAQFFGFLFNALHKRTRVAFYIQVKALLMLNTFKGIFQ